MFANNVTGSLDIGSNSIKGVSLKGNKIDKVGIEPIPNGAILSGNIEDHMAVTDSLKNIIRRIGLKGQNIAVSLPIQNFFVKFLEIAKVSEKEKRFLVEGELEDLVPNFAPEDYITQYVVADDLGDREQVMALTIQKSRINEMIELLTSLKVKPVLILPDFISIFNLLQHLKEKIFEVRENSSIMVVDIGAEATKIFIEKDGNIRMQRIAAIGGNDFTDIIERNQGMDYEEAEKFKRGIELKDESEAGGDDSQDILDELHQEITDIVKEMCNQILRSIDYYKVQEGIMGLDGIIITGGATVLNGFERVLEKNLLMEMKHFNMADFTISNKEMHDFLDKNKSRFAAAIGSLVSEVSIQ